MKTIMDVKQTFQSWSPEYPYLGMYFPYDDKKSYLIVLFHKPKEGILVHHSPDHRTLPVGHYSTDWIEKEFRRFEGQLTLAND